MEERGFRTAAAARFGWFAAGHFLLSICVCSIVWLLLLAIGALSGSTGEELARALYGGIAVLAMGAYFPAGALTAALRKWAPPASRREAVLAVLLPALVAWAWEGTVILSLLHADWPVLASIAVALVYLALFLATPSVIFVFFCIIVLDFGWWGGAAFWIMAVLAGLLPPLLFAAGSFWQAGRSAPPEGGPQ